MLTVAQPRLLYTRDFCGKQLRWHIVQDPCDHRKAPDVIFDDPTFCPLVLPSTSCQQQLAALLDGWDSTTDSQPLPALIQLLLSLYTDHQRARIAALGDDRISFELAMVADLGCTEMLLAASANNQVQRACFSIPLYPNLASAEQLIKHLQASSKSSTLTSVQQQQQQQQEEGGQASLIQDLHGQHPFVLHIAFKVGPGIDSHTAPDLQLQAASWFRDYLPPLSLPSWDPQTSLLEYVPHLTERLSKHLQDTCPAATLRFDLVNALAGVLGAPAEVNMCSSSKGGSSSTLGPAGASAATGKGQYSSIAMFLVMFDQQQLLLFVELGSGFPAEAPALVLQNLRYQGAESFTALSNIPWSPRWPVDEMTARLFNFIKQQAASITREQAQQAIAAPGVPGAVY